MNYSLENKGVSTHDGFPNPATDTSLQSLDLNSLLIKHSASTYLMRISGNDWRALGILAGDIAIVDRALDARANDIVIWHQGEQLIMSYRSKVASEAAIWGVVTSIIHQYRPKR